MQLLILDATQTKFVTCRSWSMTCTAYYQIWSWWCLCLRLGINQKKKVRLFQDQQKALKRTILKIRKLEWTSWNADLTCLMILVRKKGKSNNSLVGKFMNSKFSPGLVPPENFLAPYEFPPPEYGKMAVGIHCTSKATPIIFIHCAMTRRASASSSWLSAIGLKFEGLISLILNKRVLNKLSW